MMQLGYQTVEEYLPFFVACCSQSGLYKDTTNLSDNITKSNNCGSQKHETGKRKYSNPLSKKNLKKNEKCYGTWYANIGSSRCTLKFVTIRRTNK